MGKYFSVDLQGSGTVDVESFGSFLQRLAFAHGVSVGQLLSHMAEQPEFRAKVRRVPTYLFWAESLAICNYGDELSAFVEAVSQLTGIKNLRLSTFLFLQDAMSRKGCRVVRKTRAWCPACYEEMKNSATPVYDKLLWASQFVGRCANHAIQLLERCPACNHLQRYGTSSHMDQCVECSASLVGTPDEWAPASQCGVGEADVGELISWAVESGKNLDQYALARFLAALRRRNSPNIPKASSIRSIVGEQTVARHGKPTLARCIQLAAEMDVPLRLIFQDPDVAASIATLGISERPRLPVVPGRRLSKPEQERLKAEIVRIIKSDDSEIPPAVSVVCEFLGVESGWFRNRYPILFKRLSRRRLLAIYRVRNWKNKKVRIALQHGLYAKYLLGEISSKDSLVNVLVRDCGISKSCARHGLMIFEYTKPKPKSRRQTDRYPW